MKLRVTKSLFIDAFETYNQKYQFSYLGLVDKLFDYLTELESHDDCAELELDVDFCCCRFVEYEYREFAKKRTYEVEIQEAIRGLEKGDMDYDDFKKIIREFVEKERYLLQ